MINASVQYVSGVYTLTITNATTGTSATETVNGSFTNSSAEWIVEAPSSGGILPLANFGTVSFSNVKYNGAALTSSNQAIAINISSFGGLQTSTNNVTTSATTGTGFSVTWLSSGSSGGGGGYYGLGGYGQGGYGLGGFGGLGFGGYSLAQQQAALDQLLGSGLSFY